METIEVHTKSRPSTVVCGAGAAEAASAYLRGAQTFVVTDSNVSALYADTIARLFPGAPVCVIPAGERHKNRTSLFRVLDAMLEARLHRSSVVVAFGGGVVGDIAGLAAALYMRGIDCIQVPTTLLAQVDSSVGGKTAVDFCGIKNLVGVFRQPTYVYVDPAFLATLPAREIRCGLGEIIKHGALSPEIFDTLEQNRDKLTDLAFLADIVPANVAFKANVVREDAREGNLRKCLNLGHTTAHAFELLDGKLSHGEYVLIGTCIEAEISASRGGDTAYLARLERLCLRALGTMPALPDPAEAARVACLDKKNTGRGRIVLTVPVAKGEYRLLELGAEEYERELGRIGRKLCSDLP